MLGTALARPEIAKRQIEIAHREGARLVAHGATGKGNDQVRFELTYHALDPTIKVISPWKDAAFLAEFQGRSDMIAYANRHGIEVKASADRPYSEDGNLIHISHESGILEDPRTAPEEHVFSLTRSPKDAPDRETLLSVIFKDGIPVRVVDETNGIDETDPLRLFLLLNRIGAENGVGRVDMVENRFVGIKSRGVYETPGMTILRTATWISRASPWTGRSCASGTCSPEVRRDRLQRLLVLARDGFPHGRDRQEPGGHRRRRAPGRLQGQRHGPRPRIAQLALRQGAVEHGHRGRVQPAGLGGFHCHPRPPPRGHNAIMTRQGKKVTDFMGNGR